MNEKKIKILQVNKFYYPWIGGVEKVAQDLSEGLKDRADITVLACQPKGKMAEETISGVKVIKAGSFGRLFSMPISFSFFRYFKKLSKKSNVICIHMPFPLADLASLFFGKNKKILLWWHSDVVKQKKLMLIYRPLLVWMLRRADSIIVATEGHINGSKYLNAFQDKCKVIPFGIDLKKYPEQNKKILTSLLYKKSHKKVLFVGRLVYYKGIDVLIESFRNVSGCELFIVGDGVLRDSLKEKTKAYNLHNAVHFMGKLSDNELKAAFADCDIFVLPSVENSEAFGLVQLEAMVYKKPVINTSLSTGVPFVSLDGITGLTVRPSDPDSLADAIQKLADNDELRKNFGENAFDRVKNVFIQEKMLDGFLDECKHIIKK